jgi:hypothetical protein
MRLHTLTNTNRFILMRIAYITCLLLLPVCPLVPQADSGTAPERIDPGAFYGFWEFQEPAGDKSVIIIKRGGRLSCFWAGTRNQSIQKGTWERTESQLTARWDTGHVDVFRKLGDNAIERSSYDPGMSLIGDPTLVIRGVRVDSRIPGSLTVENEGGRERIQQPADAGEAPATPIRHAYIGFWRVDQSTGLFGLRGGEPQFYLRLARSGEASVALRNWEGDQAVRGRWILEGGRVVITWPNNRRDVLFPNNRDDGHLLASFRPKDKLTDNPRSSVKAEKIPATEAERYFDAGNVKRLTVDDIRGTWRPVERTGDRGYISIEGWGNAYRYPSAGGGAGTDPGKWRLLDDRVVITWVDGSRDVIRSAFPEPVQESYESAESVTPVRSFPVVRTD